MNEHWFFKKRDLNLNLVPTFYLQREMIDEKLLASVGTFYDITMTWNYQYNYHNVYCTGVEVELSLGKQG